MDLLYNQSQDGPPPDAVRKGGGQELQTYRECDQHMDEQIIKDMLEKIPASPSNRELEESGRYLGKN